MGAVKLLVAFLFMLFIIFRFKKSLVLVFALGCVAVALTYSFDPVFAAKLAVQSAFSRSALPIVAIYYTVN